MVEGLHESMRHAVDRAEEASRRPQLDPAPQHVLDAIEGLDLDAHTLGNMRQTPQCVICCADFEVGERLSRLPGCGHLFHDSCVSQWLERATNCPICRNDLVEAVRTRSVVKRSAGLEEAAVTSPTEQLSLQSAVEAAAVAATAASSALVAAVDAPAPSSSTSTSGRSAPLDRRSGSSVLIGAGSAISISGMSPNASTEAGCRSGRPGSSSSLMGIGW
jgi:hypothetical protein